MGLHIMSGSCTWLTPDGPQDEKEEVAGGVEDLYRLRQVANGILPVGTELVRVA